MTRSWRRRHGEQRWRAIRSARGALNAGHSPIRAAERGDAEKRQFLPPRHRVSAACFRLEVAKPVEVLRNLRHSIIVPDAMIRRAIGALVGVVWLSMPLFAQIPAGEPPDGPVIQAVRIEGASVFTTAELASRYDLAEGTRLNRSTDEIARAIRDRYHNDGYTFTTVEASFDPASGTLTITHRRRALRRCRRDRGRRGRAAANHGRTGAGARRGVQRLAGKPGTGRSAGVCARCHRPIGADVHASQRCR